QAPKINITIVARRPTEIFFAELKEESEYFRQVSEHPPHCGNIHFSIGLICRARAAIRAWLQFERDTCLALFKRNLSLRKWAPITVPERTHVEARYEPIVRDEGLSHHRNFCDHR